MRKLACALAILAASGVVARASNDTLTLPCETKGIRISRDAGTAALYCADKSGSIIALPSGKLLRTVAPQTAMDALIAPDGAWLVLLRKDGAIAAYPTHTAAAPKTWSVGVMPSSYVFLANGLLLIDRTFWDVPNARAVHSLETDFDVVNGAATNASRVVTANADTTIRAYDTPGWKQRFVSRDMLMEPFGIAFTADGSKIVVGGADYHVSILDAASGRTIKAFPPFKDYINDIVALASKDWVAVQFANDRTADPSYWVFFNLDTGAMKHVCGKNTLVRFTSTHARCFTMKGSRLEVVSEPLPGG